jgi:hypothetical protein
MLMGLDDESPELLARGNPLWQRDLRSAIGLF